jgi:hypothetical protein
MSQTDGPWWHARKRAPAYHAAARADMQTWSGKGLLSAVESALH